ncbi:conserved protein of unknown function [Thermococcus nautili]|uniref:hypothetical protein n=1 Tax=Thermococcus nautili TaxID=195522 RepID=UPI002554CAF8|nr:hypothetical protein [Thermococcus nautili]CAI1493984.1 conserved protein of unknown function [Thermococcus nautili]
MAISVKNSEGVRLLIEEVAKAVGVSPGELLEYYEWKATLEKLKRVTSKKMTNEEAITFLQSQMGKRKISEEKAVELYYEVREEIKRWEQIERRLKQLGLE